jgi:DNA-binding NarL/FixJ family response regulator
LEKKLRVLIADDQRSTRQGLKAVLSYCPEVEVVAEACDGEEALLVVPDTEPDLVVMDLKMPGMDGVEAIRRIKAQWPQVKIIAHTMFASRRAEALEAGADHFLVKGDAAQSLKEIINLCCGPLTPME